jgi:hypothetical protein
LDFDYDCGCAPKVGEHALPPVPKRIEVKLATAKGEYSDCCSVDDNYRRVYVGYIFDVAPGPNCAVVDKIREPALHCPVEVVQGFERKNMDVHAALYGPAEVVFAFLARFHFEVRPRGRFVGFERSQILAIEVEGLYGKVLLEVVLKTLNPLLEVVSLGPNVGCSECGECKK